MFEISFRPFYDAGVSLTVSAAGSVLLVNGDSIDFSALEDGDILPDEEADALHRYIVYAPIQRVGDTIHLTLAQPFGQNTEAWDGPPIKVLGDGPVDLPFPAEESPEEEEEEEEEAKPKLKPKPKPKPKNIKVDGEKIIRAATNAVALRQSAIAAIKAECGRRILEIMPSHKQVNSLALHAEASMLHGSDPSLWPTDLQAEQAATLPLWAEIKRLRARSNEIEEMDQFPEDVTDEALWS